MTKALVSAATEKASLEFLGRDFEQCFEQMRHYDDQIWDLFKFTFATYTALIGAAVGLYQYSLEKHVNLIPSAIALVAVGSLFGIFMFSLIIRNRVYFVCVARYINEHRGFFLKNKPFGFSNSSRMYTNPAFPRFFNWRSSHSFFFYIVATMNSVLFAGAVYMASNGYPYRDKITLYIFGSALLLQVLIGVLYLLTREEKSATHAVFGHK